MKNRKSQFILLVIIGIGFLSVGIVAIVKELGFKLENQSQVTGRVELRDFVYYGSRRHQERYIRFRLDNSDQDFIVNLRIADASLDRYLNLGDTVRVYFKPATKGYNESVFQVEQNGKKLLSYNNYDKHASEKAIIAMFAGIFIIAVCFFKFKRINFWRWLNCLVE